MLRLSFLFLGLLSSLGAAETSSVDALLKRLGEVSNPFSPAVTGPDPGTSDNLYAALTGITGAIFGHNGGGCIVLDARPWRTGERRLVVTTAGRVKIDFVRLDPAEGGHSASALFKAEGEKEISVDVRSSEAPVETLGEAAGWLLTGTLMVTADRIPSSELRVKVRQSVFLGKAVARSSSTGLTLITMTETVALPLSVAPANYSGVARVMPLHNEMVRVPSSVLKKPVTKEYLIGALVTTEDGRLLGVLGHEGIVSPEALGLECSLTTSEVSGSPYSRRVTFTADGFSK